MTYINKPTKTSRSYDAGLNGITIKLHAESLIAAKEEAVRYFKPKLKNKHLVWVRLETETVTKL